MEEEGEDFEELKLGYLALTVVLAAVQFEAHADGSKVQAVWQDTDHVCAHNWWRKFIAHCSLDVLICFQQLWWLRVWVGFSSSISIDLLWLLFWRPLRNIGPI